MSTVEVSHLTKTYRLPGGGGRFLAVNDISFSIRAGEIYGILGPNGAGKTTTLEMLEGICDIDEGDAVIGGFSVRRSPYDVKAIIGVQLQSSEYFDKLSLVELLQLFGRLYGRKVDAMDLLRSVALQEKAKATPDSLSGGMRQRFSIACALVNDPQVLFLDEPTTGLDPQARRNLWDLVRSLNAAGMTIILTTHNMEEAETLCDRIAIMDAGSFIAEGTPADLIATHAPHPPRARLTGNIEDVFLQLTGYALRDN